MFLGPTVWRWRSKTRISAARFTRSDALGSFFVVRSRFGCWPTPQRNAAHDDLEAIFLTRDQQPITHMHQTRSFDSFSIDVHQATLHGVCCERTALEKACKPEPFVDANPGSRLGRIIS